MRKQPSKAIPGRKPKREVETRSPGLVDDSIESARCRRHLQGSGDRKGRHLDSGRELQTFKDRKHENLRLKLPRAAATPGDLPAREHNLARRQKSFRSYWRRRAQRYHSRIIDAAAVVEEMVRMRRDFEASDARAKLLGLAEDEVAFYDAEAETYETIYQQQFLRDSEPRGRAVHQDESQSRLDRSHRDDVRAAIRSAVKRVLRQRRVKAEEDFEPLRAASDGSGRGAVR